MEDKSNAAPALVDPSEAQRRQATTRFAVLRPYPEGDGPLARTARDATFVLTRHWRRLGLAPDDADFADTQAIAAIARIAGGNFRLLHRLFVQIGRILKIDDLSVVAEDVVEAARSTLVIGAT